MRYLNMHLPAANLKTLLIHENFKTEKGSIEANLLLVFVKLQIVHLVRYASGSGLSSQKQTEDFLRSETPNVLKILSLEASV